MVKVFTFYDVNGKEIKLGDKLKLIKDDYPAPIGTIETVTDEMEDGLLYVDTFPITEFNTEDFEIVEEASK